MPPRGEERGNAIGGSKRSKQTSKGTALGVGSHSALMGEISRPRLYLSLFSWARWEEKLICVAVSCSGGEADTCDRVEWGRLMGRTERKRESFFLFEGIKRAEEAAAAPHSKEPLE